MSRSPLVLCQPIYIHHPFCLFISNFVVLSFQYNPFIFPCVWWSLPKCFFVLNNCSHCGRSQRTTQAGIGNGTRLSSVQIAETKSLVPIAWFTVLKPGLKALVSFWNASLWAIAICVSLSWELPHSTLERRSICTLVHLDFLNYRYRKGTCYFARNFFTSVWLLSFSRKILNDFTSLLLAHIAF